MISMTRRNLNAKVEAFIKAGNRNFFQKPPIILFISSRKSFTCIEPITFGQQILLSSCWGRIRTWTTQSAARWRCGSGWRLRCCRCCASGWRQGAENFTFKIKLGGNFSFLSNPFSKCSETKTLPLNTNYSISVSKIGGKLVTAFLVPDAWPAISKNTHFPYLLRCIFPKLY